jgi:hypothetical protein
MWQKLVYCIAAATDDLLPINNGNKAAAAGFLVS